jgi:uncharacterized protein YndB with AHSA1/START domain
MHRASIDIAASPELVFAYMTDPRHVKSWQPDVVESQPLPAGGLCVGTRLRSTVQEYGRRFEVELRIAAIAANEHVAYEMEAPTASIHSEFRLTRKGNSTRVEHLVTVRLKGLGRLLMPFAKGMVQRKLESRLKLLRDAVEAEREDPSRGFAASAAKPAV